MRLAVSKCLDMLFPKGQHIFFAPAVTPEGQPVAVEFVADGRVLVERELERLLPVGYLQPLLVAVGFETPENIFVVEIGSGVGEVAIYFGNHFPSDLSEELRAAQRQPSVSDPVIDAAVIGRAGDVTKNSF
mgnify:CR=1 FL=1